MFRFLFRKKKKEVRFFVSIGAGTHQLPLIRAAKQLGLLVIAVDQNSGAPGFQSADIRIQESIDDVDEIYTKLQELLLNGTIVAVMTRSYGIATRTVADLCNRIGLQNLPLESVDILMSKKKMKTLFQKSLIPCAKAHSYTKRSKKKIPYPLVIKPVFGHAKQGVRLINDDKQMEESIKDTSSEVVIEEYIPGDEIIAFGIVNQGRFHLYEITDKYVTKAPFFCDVMHVSPSIHVSRYSEIRAIGQTIAESASIFNSPLLLELKISKDNTMYIIETAPEFGGEYIADTLIPVSTGYDIIKDCIRASIGNIPLFPQQNHNREAVAVKYITSQTRGILHSAVPLSPKLPGLLFSKLFTQIGSIVNPARSNHDRVGVIAVSAKTREAAIEKANEYETRMEIKIS